MNEQSQCKEISNWLEAVGTAPALSEVALADLAETLEDVVLAYARCGDSRTD
jgi:hypothetical protein